VSDLLSEKWMNKYMRLAKALADDNQSCYSRKIGVILVTADNSATCGGWNGTVRNSPANDSHDRLWHLWNDRLTNEQKVQLHEKAGIKDGCDFVGKYTHCGKCPRAILGIPSGQQLDLCNCAHAERNALANAGRAGLVTLGSVMYCYCKLPCHDCAIQIIQCGVEAVVCLEPGNDKDYSPSSRQMFKDAGVKVFPVSHEKIFGHAYGQVYRT
jgi:deoxycytidylate deaminase